MHLQEEIEIKQPSEIITDDNTKWDSLCFRLNKGFVKFLAQFAVSVLVLSICSYKILNIDEKEDKSLYVSLITLILGVYLPQPNIK